MIDTVAYFLNLYGERLEPTDEGAPEPDPAMAEFARDFIAKLSEMDPDEQVDCQVVGAAVVFTRESTKEVITTMERPVKPN